MGLGYPQGLSKKKIPYEGQIIRVADEYDAIVSKRQYKSHIGICDTLKILIENATKPNEKNNPIIVKTLLKVVIDDTNYLEEIQSDIKRLTQIEKYHQKMEKSSNQKTKDYYYEGMKVLFRRDETIDNYKSVLEEYHQAYIVRKNIINNLYAEIKNIKKLRV
jgi:glycine cleavage system protein P-like pyridoxal-binding family